MKFPHLLLAGSVVGAASIASAQVADFSTWTLVQDPAHALLTSAASSSSITLFAGNGPIPNGTDIGYQSVNGNTAATSSSGHAFSLTQNFGFAVDYAFSASGVVGNLGFGLGLGEDVNGTNSAGVVIAVNNGVPFIAGGASRTNDVNGPTGFIGFSPAATGSLHVSFDASNGSVKVGTGLVGLNVPNLNFTYSNIASSWTGADLFPAFFLRSDATLGAAYSAGNANVTFSNFRVTGGSIGAVPEPATYAALFGVLALAFAAWRGRKA